MSYASQLAEVQAAITKVMGGQEVTIAGRTLRRADLKTLTDREKYLQTMASREATGGVLSVSAANTSGR